MEKVSNYELQRRQWQRRFLDMDHAALRQKLPELEETADQLRLWHFGRQFAVSREDGAIRCLSDDGPVSYNEQMNIYTLFHYCAPGAHLTGEWLPFRDLRHASPFAAAFQRGTVLPLARTFSGRGDLLPAAVEKLRGHGFHPRGERRHHRLRGPLPSGGGRRAGAGQGLYVRMPGLFIS